MGMIRAMGALVAGPGQDRLADLARLLRDAAEADGGRGLPQEPQQRAVYDRLVDALNRLPRPAMALGTVLMLGAAMVAPEWFSGRMEALAEIPEAMWWVIGAIISLFFGARFQTQEQTFQKTLVETLVRGEAALPVVGPLTPLVADTGRDAGMTLAASTPAANAALGAWTAAAD